MKLNLECGQDQPITKKGQGRGKGKSSSKKSFSSYMMVDSNILWSDIQEFAKAKYEVNCSHYQVEHIYLIVYGTVVTFLSQLNFYYSNHLKLTRAYFQFELPELSRTTAKKVSVLRNLCQKVNN